MRFISFTSSQVPSSVPGVFSLVRDNWDDFGFQTQFRLFFAPSDGEVRELGWVKVGMLGMAERGGSTELPRFFQALPETFFSVGQDREYYEAVRDLGEVHRRFVLTGLRDISFSEESYQVALGEPVTQISLFRRVDSVFVERQFRRIARGGLTREGFQFAFEYGIGAEVERATFRFKVEPESTPPTNVHVLIGENGVGKTTLLNAMALSVARPGGVGNSGTFSEDGPTDATGTFSSVVAIAFSAFDPFDPAALDKGDSRITFTYVGLNDLISAGKQVPAEARINSLLNEAFRTSLKRISRGPKRERLLWAVRQLETEVLVGRLGLGDLLAGTGGWPVAAAAKIFSDASSGHKIVLLTVVKLIELVEERTLVLIDEPESHLHPPLLSVFMRVLSELMEDRNGAAIVATHSPVVLQEVPKRAALIVARSDAGQLVGSRPIIETFGENLGTLNREVFGLQITRSGFHRTLQQLVALNMDFDKTMRRADNALGLEAQSILRALIAVRDSEGGKP